MSGVFFHDLELDLHFDLEERPIDGTLEDVPLQQALASGTACRPSVSLPA